MCLIVLLGGVFVVTLEMRLLGVLTKALGPYGSSWVLGLILVSFWVGSRLLARARDPRYAAQWSEWAMSGNPRARPQDALVPAAQALGGLLLMVPGPLTDLLGLALQSPLIARLAAGRLMGSAAGVVLGGAPRGGFGGLGGGFEGFGRAPEQPQAAPASDEPAEGARRRRRKGQGGGQGGGQEGAQGGGKGSGGVIDVQGSVRRDEP